MSHRPRLLVVAGLVAFGLSVGSDGLAQTYPSNPYAPGAGAYRQAAPSSRSSRSRSLPGRGVPSSVRNSGAAAFQDFLDDGLGSDDDDEGMNPARGRSRGGDRFDDPFGFSTGRRGSSASSRTLDLYGGGFDDPDDRPYRLSGSMLDTPLSPRERQARKDLYVDYLKERDPAKRAQLYREYRQNLNGTGSSIGTRTSRAARRSSALDESPSLYGSSTRSTRSGSLSSGLRGGSSILDRDSSRDSSRGSSLGSSTSSSLFPSSSSSSSSRSRSDSSSLLFGSGRGTSSSSTTRTPSSLLPRSSSSRVP